MNRKTIVINLIVLLGVIAGFLFNPSIARAGYSEREKQLATILASAVEFRWDTDRDVRRSHESLGTKIGANTVLTHNHFSDLAATFIVDPSNPRRPHGVSDTTKTRTIGGSYRFRAQIRLVYSTVKYAGSFAPIASQSTINQLKVGDTVDVVYWDEIHNQFAVTVLQIKALQGDTVIVLNDPMDIITPGDSGGGVFYDGELIGNTWRFIKTWDSRGNLLGKEVQVSIVPAELTRVLETW